MSVVEEEDIDREGLVKDIEQIRRTLGCINSANDEHTVCEVADEYEPSERESDESDDDLAIIMSPRYRESTDEECQLKKQRVSVTVVSSESDAEPAFDDSILHTSLKTAPAVNSAQKQKTSYQSSMNVSTNGEVEQLETDLPDNNVNLVGLQPVVPTTVFVSDSCLDPDNDMEARQHQTPIPGVSDRVDVPQNDGKTTESMGSGVYCLLNLNRQYQTVIQQELRRIERLLLENKEKQLGLTHITQAALLQAEVLAFKQLTSYVKPYFRDKRKDCQGPPPNEDTSLRMSLNQPSPFQRRAKPWMKDEIDSLTDGVMAAVLETKLTPFMQRVEALTPRRCKTMEEEKELEQLNIEIHRIKDSSFVSLLGDHSVPIDWSDITNKVLPLRTPFQCEIYWYNELHPLLNKNEWTQQEDKKLLKIAKAANEQDWSGISRKLMTNRSALQCLKRYQRNINKTFMKSKWDLAEDKKLLAAVKICGLGAWERVSSLLEGRTGSQCMQRYVKSVNPSIRKGKWSEEEDNLLAKGMEKFGPIWSKIRYMIPHRSDAQIRERWCDVLDPTINRGPWTAKEDEILLNMVDELGTSNWSKIASHLKGRNDNRCCRRWKFLIRNPELLPELCREKDLMSTPTMTRNHTTNRKPVCQKSISCFPPPRHVEPLSLANKQTNSVPKRVQNGETNTTSVREETTKVAGRTRMTKPYPEIIFKATALNKSLPMNYLPQFSVLLQAFSVDVSGALENVHASGSGSKRSYSKTKSKSPADARSKDASTGAEEVARTDVVLSDSRHGLTHEIVLTTDSQEKSVAETPSPGKSKRKRTKGKSVAKKRKTSESRKDEKHDDEDDCLIEQEDDSNATTTLTNGVKRRKGKPRYPVRSTRSKSKLDAVVQDDTDDETYDETHKSSDKKKMSKKKCKIKREQNEVRPTPSVPQAVFPTPVPPLPPSATTLDAFRKLLVLRKSLQKQASRCNNQVASTDGSSVVSESSPEIFKSVPYQQLLNRFNSMFLWPGFLSIVNPESSNTQHNKLDTKTKNTNAP